MSFHLQDFWNPGTSWKELDEEFDKGYMKCLDRFLRSQPAGGFYPEEKSIFKAFDVTPLDRVNVVILGQDPYFREGRRRAWPSPSRRLRRSRSVLGAFAPSSRRSRTTLGLRRRLRVI